jgi:hypothetical protein
MTTQRLVGAEYRPEYEAIFKVKRQICARLRRAVRPLLWESGFGPYRGTGDRTHTRLVSFKHLGMPQEYYTIRKAVSDTPEFNGFTSTGTFANGTCCIVTTDFEQWPVEDLIRIENWLARRINMMIGLRAAMKKKAKEEQCPPNRK